MTRDPVRVQLVWHFHQPYYGLPSRSTNYLPWVRLHAIKSYYDMARKLEDHPEIRATVNFSGSLLRQIREYVEEGRRDTWWDLSLKPANALDEHDKRHMLRHFFSINWEHCIRAYPRYSELLDRRGIEGFSTPLDVFDNAAYRDLQVWFNLAWFGFSAREERPIVKELIAKGRGFTESEKEALLEQQMDLMKLVIPLYRKLHRRGQIELTVTPMYHPILPLLIDTDAARRATPDRPLPKRFQAPQDAAEHVYGARSIAREFLGVDPDGMWPAEGSISPEAIEMFAGQEVNWVASDEDVLRGSLPTWDRKRDLYRPWRLGEHQTAIFFRDHGLSDNIGFVYAKNQPQAAARDFVDRVRDTEGHVVSVILDGENPWEHYPNDGRDFLEALYVELENQEEVTTTYPSRYLEEFGCEAKLDRLHSGSWILGNYQIWIGHPETNKGWEYVRRTRSDLVEHLESTSVDPEVEELAWEALHVAEGSDWFWWYGDDFTSENDADFDRLFREQLRFVYASTGMEIAKFVDEPIAQSPPPDAHFEVPQRLISPRIDGRTESFYEWQGAGVYKNTGAHGSMFESVRFVDRIHLGFDLASLYLRVDYGSDMQQRKDEFMLRAYVQHARGDFVVHLTARGGGAGRVEWIQEGNSLVLDEVVFGSSVEAAVPFSDLELAAGDRFQIWFSFADERMELERHPAEGSLDLDVPDRSFEMRNWLV